jgi:hypothetical protein
MSVYNAIKYNVPFASAGGLIALSTQTASSSASVSFTSGIDSTYSEYLFIFNNIHPETNNTHLQFNMSIDGGSNYNVTKTTSHFRAYHEENGASAAIGYRTGDDLAQSTAYQTLILEQGNDNDANGAGILHLFDPSNTNFVKHFIFRGITDQSGNTARETYVAGYGNTTSAINAVNFQMSSGNIDAGTIQMFGVVK